MKFQTAFTTPIFMTWWPHDHLTSLRLV